MRATGIDISHWSGKYTYKPIDSFVIIKATDGTYQDDKFAINMPEVTKAPVRGAFHYMRSGTDWTMQANAFITAVKDWDLHFYVCDYEETGNIMSKTFAAMVYEWMNYVQMQTGKPVLLYTRASLYDQLYDWDNRVKAFYLWLANYPFNADPQNGTPRLPVRPYQGWKIWQYSGDVAPGAPHGVESASVELDVYNGTLDEMKAWLGVGSVTPPLPDMSVVLPSITLTMPDGSVYKAANVELKKV